jgi:hypothetical protein
MLKSKAPEIISHGDSPKLTREKQTPGPYPDAFINIPPFLAFH